MLKSASGLGRFTSVKLPTASHTVDIEEDAGWITELVRTSQRRWRIFSLPGTEHIFIGFAASSPINIRCSDAHLVRFREIFFFKPYKFNLLNISRNETYCEVVEDKHSHALQPRRIRKYGVCLDNYIDGSESIGIYSPVHLQICRSKWPRGLRRRPAATRLLRLWVRIPLGLCDELITLSEESYRP